MAEQGLFDRLPQGLFAPLASPNQISYWNLLLRLFDRYFGPDASPPEGDGFVRRSITLEIERFIQEDPNWITEEGSEGPETPLSIRSNYIFNRLIDAGWLREDRLGVRWFIVMPTPVQKFLELLRQFAEEGPQLIGGKVQMIYNQLQQAALNPEKEFGGFHEAALQARQLISILSAITMRVREAMHLLSKQDSTASYVRSFFDNYIGQLYIRDYHDLRTENHPLRHRWDIIKIAHLLRDDPAKRRLMIDNYQVAFRCATRQEAEDRFEKDVLRLLMFSEIDTYLDRLNTSVDRATSRAIDYLQYKLRTQTNLDRLLSHAINRIKDPESGAQISSGLLLPGALIADTCLPPSVRRNTPPQRTVMQKKVMTIEQRATIRLRRAMKMSREVTIEQIRKYLAAHLDGKGIIDSDALPIATIHDFCLFVVVARLALISRNHAGAGHKAHPMLMGLREYRFECLSGEKTDNPYLCVPKFTVSNRHQEARHAA